MTLLAPAPPERRERIEPADKEQRLVLGAVDWATYQTISKALTGRHVRLSYDRGRLEFMTISSKHGILSRLINRLIAILTEEMNLPILSCGDMTCDNEQVLRGLEPDECFYLDNEPRVRGKEEIDLTIDPPPDLAIEIDITSGSIPKFPIYAAFLVPEIWRYDGKQARIYHLMDQNYFEHNASLSFSFLSARAMTDFLEQSKTQGQTAALAAFRQWVRAAKA